MKNCLHCGEPISNARHDFCCNGCSTAYSIIKALDLKVFYKYCKEIYASRPNKVNEIQNDLDYKSFVESKSDGSHSINLLVEGMHCGSCVWLIENTLKKQDGVLNARVNLSTKRLVLEWKGAPEKILELVTLITNLGYKLIPFEIDAAEIEGQQIETDLLLRMGVAGFAIVAMMMTLWGVWTGLADGSLGKYATFLFNLIATSIALPASLYSGIPFFKSGLNAIKHRRSNMDVAISIAVIVTLIISVYQTFSGSDYVYYDAAVSLIFFLLIGRFLDIKARNKARSFAHNLILSQPKSATIERDGKLILIPIAKLATDDIVVVNAGEKIPCDGVIYIGESEIDNSIITGESMPVIVTEGSNVFAGALNLGQTLKIKATTLAQNSTLTEMLKLIEAAEQGRAHYVQLADRVSSLYTPLVLSLSTFTAIAWIIFGSIPLSTALLYGVSVLIITCPCALGLAVPVVQIIATSKLMSQGIMVKNSQALERLAAIDKVYFDKTGTLTVGQPTWNNMEEFTKTEQEVIQSLASYSSHVLCKAIRTSSPLEFDATPTETKSQGMAGTIEGIEYKLGSAAFCGADTVNDNQIEMWFKYQPKKKGSEEMLKRLTFGDEIRDGAGDTIQYFRGLHFPTEIISGDRQSAVASVAKALEIEHYHGFLNPKQKADMLRHEKELNHKCLMVGDGLNDSIALKEAHVSISPASALEISQNYADIIFQSRALTSVVSAHKVAVFADKLVKQNFALALVYNLLTVPIACAGYATPVIAAIAMSTSSILVVLNSLRLKR